jgi:hypothetical protein
MVQILPAADTFQKFVLDVPAGRTRVIVLAKKRYGAKFLQPAGA